MIYNTIHHDIRNKASLSLLDYCILELIYNLSTSGKERYTTWCNAAKKSFTHLASERTIINRFNALEKSGWLEFKDEKRFLKKTTVKYYNDVYKQIKGVKMLRGENVAPVKELHPRGENVAPLGVKELRGRGENVAPNKKIDNKSYNKIDNESKDDTHINFIESENQKLKAELQQLKNSNSEAKKESQKSCAKKGTHQFPSNEPKKKYTVDSFPTMEEFEKAPIHQNEVLKNYELELSKFNYPNDWTEYLKGQFLEWCSLQDEKLKGRFGGTNVKALIRKINKYLKDFDALTIGDSIELSLSTPYADFNPQWVIDRQEKHKQDEERKNKQAASNGKGLYDNWADIVNEGGSSHDNETEGDTVDTSWADA